MRIERISVVNAFRYKNAQNLLRYFNLSRMKTNLPKKITLKKLEDLTLDQSGKVKDKIKSKKSLNEIAIDTMEEKLLKDNKNLNQLLKNKSDINIIKSMNQAKKGSSFNSLNFLLKNQSKIEEMGLLQKQNFKDYDKSYSYDKSKVDIYNKSKEQKNIKNVNLNKNNILKKYEELEKILLEKKDEEKKNKEQNDKILKDSKGTPINNIENKIE